jgi:hypothetical protein
VVACVVCVGPNFEDRRVSVSSESDPVVERTGEIADDSFDGGPVDGPRVGAVSADDSDVSS